MMHDTGIWHVICSDLYRWYMTCNMLRYIYGGQVSEGGSHLLELVQQRTLSAHSYYFCFFFLLFPISYFLFLFSYFFFLISYFFFLIFFVIFGRVRGKFYFFIFNQIYICYQKYIFHTWHMYI